MVLFRDPDDGTKGGFSDSPWPESVQPLTRGAVSAEGPRSDTGSEQVSLGPEDGKALLAIARASIHCHLTTAEAPPFTSAPPALLREQGAFVTLRKKGKLRGCIGHTEADTPLGELVGEMAVRAALDDPRFPRVRPEELEDLEIEVSVLTLPRKVQTAEEIVPGRDGVLLSGQGHSAVFLPEVATEQGWDREELLDELCLKAGLAAGSWRGAVELFTFRTVAFHEEAQG